MTTTATARAADSWIDAHRRPLWWLAGGLTVGAVALWLLAKFTGVLPGPGSLRPGDVLAELPGAAREASEAEASLAEPVAALVTVPVIAALGWYHGGARLAALAPLGSSVVVLTSLAKRAGPDITLPSGHAAYAVAVLGSGSVLLWRGGSRAGAVALAGVALVMGPVRVIDGAHHPVDVVAGDALGLAWLLGALLLVTPAANRRQARDKRQMPGGRSGSSPASA